MGATSFLIAAMGQPRAELQSTISDEAKLMAAAARHEIKPEWARYWITQELGRNDRRN